MGKGRAPCCDKVGLNKGTWSPEEDLRLIAHIQRYGHANWRALPKKAGTPFHHFFFPFKALISMFISLLLFSGIKQG